MQWKNEICKLKDLKPNPKNPRRLDSETKRKLLANLEKYSLINPIVIDYQKNILSGHQRVSLLSEIKGGDYKVDVRVCDTELTEAEKNEILLAENRLHAEFDFGMMSDFKFGLDLTEIGFTEKEINLFEEKKLTEIQEPKATGREEEAQHQIAVLAWANDNSALYHELRLLFHIPNGAKTGQGRRKLKKMGAKNGVPDLFLPVARSGKHGLFIELKRPEGLDNDAGKPSNEQESWIYDLRAEGFEAIVCVGAKQAVEAIKSYLGISV